MKLCYPLLSLLGLGSYIAHAQQVPLASALSEPVVAPGLRTAPGTHLYTSFEESTKNAISGAHLQPVPSAAHARTGETSLLLARGKGTNKAYFSLSHLLPAKAGQSVKASLYASYSSQSHTVDRVLQAAALAAAAYGQSQPLPTVPSEQPTSKRSIPYLGIGLALTPTVKSLHRATPKAYLRYSVYNADTVLVASDIRPVDRTARDNWQELSFAETMPVDGFVQLTFANESRQPVRVDDLSLLIDAGTPAPVGKLKGSIANDLGVQAYGNCIGFNVPLPEVPITSPPPPHDPYPYIPPGYFPGDNYPPSNPNPVPNPSPGSPGEPGSPDGPGSPEPTLIIDNKLDPCAGKVLSDIKAIGYGSPLTAGPISNLIYGMTNNPSVNITFSQQPNLVSPNNGAIDRAQTVSQGNGNFNIIMNSDFLTGNSSATDLAIATDMIHEVLHAYMYDWATNHNLSPNLSLDAIMNAYSTSGDQHVSMSYMVQYMGEALLTYYNTTFMTSHRLLNIDQNYCESLIWGGLTGTITYQDRKAADPLWAKNVIAIRTAEQQPADAGKAYGTDSPRATVPYPRGGQPCK